MKKYLWEVYWRSGEDGRFRDGFFISGFDDDLRFQKALRTFWNRNGEMKNIGEIVEI